MYLYLIKEKEVGTVKIKFRNLKFVKTITFNSQ